MAADNSGHKRVACVGADFLYMDVLVSRRTGCPVAMSRERGTAWFTLDSTDAGSYCLPLPAIRRGTHLVQGIFMGHRLSKIYTRTGDDGTTGLGDGSRVDKDSARVEAYGTVDETNCTIGVVLGFDSVPDDVRRCLTDVQHDLFELGGELCIPGHAAVRPEFVARLEQDLDRFNDDLPPLKEFILPGGSEAAARCHMARSVARRAERRCWTLGGSEDVNELALVYLNRLSDLLFVLARVLARVAGGSEILWDRNRLK